MALSQSKHAQLTHDTINHRLIFSNHGEAYLEVGRDKGTDGMVAIVKIPEAKGDQTEADWDYKYKILLEELRDADVPIIMDESKQKPEGQLSKAVCIEQEHFQLLGQYLQRKSELTTNKVASLPARAEMDEQVLSPGARLIDYLKGDERYPTKVIEESNRIRASLGESIGHAGRASETRESRIR